MTNRVDLRSDTVTQPSAGMRRAMAEAEVGDDVYGDDPTVNRLQATLAERLGFEAGLLCTSSTQSNLVALMTHCQRGDEVIVGQSAHCYRNEGGGVSVLGSIHPQPIENAADGTLPLARIRAAVKPDDPHHARTKLLALENTFSGTPLPRGYCEQAIALARAAGLATHLDGARLFNAAAADGVDARELARGFDSVSICLSKGLGAPVGAVLLGSAEFIARGQRPRKMLGGAMRQSGVLAAAGLYALEHNVARLAEDHDNAAHLAAGLARIEGLSVRVATNMVFVEMDGPVAPLAAFAGARGIVIQPSPPLRLVTHLDVDRAGIERTIAAFRDFFAQRRY